MPYVRRGKSVYKADTGKKVGTSSSVTKAKQYLKALYMHAHDKKKGGASMSSRKSRYAKKMSGETSVTSETPPKYHELFEGMSGDETKVMLSRKSRYARRKKKKGLPPSGPSKHHELFEGMGFARGQGDQSPGLYQRLHRLNNLHNPFATVARGAVNAVNRVIGQPEARVSREGDLEQDPRQAIAYHEAKIRHHRGEAKRARKAKNFKTAQAHEAQARSHEAMRQYHRDQIGRFASFAQRGASMGSEAEREAARGPGNELPPDRELSEHRRQRGVAMSRKARYHAKRGRQRAPHRAPHRAAQSRMGESHSSMRYHAEHEARHAAEADQAAMRGDHELAKLHQGVAKAHGAARQHFRERITPNKHHELMG